MLLLALLVRRRRGSLLQSLPFTLHCPLLLLGRRILLPSALAPPPSVAVPTPALIVLPLRALAAALLLLLLRVLLPLSPPRPSSSCQRQRHRGAPGSHDWWAVTKARQDRRTF